MKRTLKDIAVNLDWQTDRKRYRSIYERQAEIRRRGLKEISINLDKQGIEDDYGGQKINENRNRWIDEDQAEIGKRQKQIQVDMRRIDRDEEIGVERDRREPGLTKKYT